MRQYRGVPIGCKDFVYGWYAKTEGKSYIICEDKDADIKAAAYGPFYFIYIEVIPETVGQSLGYKDLYEGDIVGNGDNYNSVIEWQCNPHQDEFIGFYLHEIYPKGEPDRFHCMFAYTTPLEAIGNIHQDPKLLENNK